MKHLIYLTLSLLFLIAFNACKKDSTSTKKNYFTFQGVEYAIQEASIIEAIVDQGTPDQNSLHLLSFVNINGNDTTEILITVFDDNDPTLVGSYPSADQCEMDAATRGMIPFALLFNSFIGFQDGTTYFTGAGGSLNVTGSNNNYTIQFNNISVGDYGDILDFDDNGDCEYTEAGKITGNFEGIIAKVSVVLSLSPQEKASVNRFLKK